MFGTYINSIRRRIGSWEKFNRKPRSISWELNPWGFPVFRFSPTKPIHWYLGAQPVPGITLSAARFCTTSCGPIAVPTPASSRSSRASLWDFMGFHLEIWGKMAEHKDLGMKHRRKMMISRNIGIDS